MTSYHRQLRLLLLMLLLLVLLLLQDPFITYADYAARAHARIAEIAAEQASVAALSIKGPDQTVTVSEVGSGAGRSATVKAWWAQ